MCLRAVGLGSPRDDDRVDSPSLDALRVEFPQNQPLREHFVRPAAIFWNEAKKASISHCSAPAFVRCGARHWAAAR
jgi:hypothetical protein